MKVYFKKLREGAIIPQYQTDGAAGMDIRACFKNTGEIVCPQEPVIVVDDTFILAPGMRVIVPTGLAVQLPDGVEAQVRSRSGMSIQLGLVVLNAPGTIDPDYRGEIGIILFNASDQNIIVKSGDRIAQIVFSQFWRPTVIEETFELSETQRGAGGFGSTGK